MKNTLRKKFVFFAMGTVTVLLAVLIGAINISSWCILDRQSDDILHMLADGNDKLLQKEDGRDRGPFQPLLDMDTLRAARFFMVCTDAAGQVQSVNIDQISSVTTEEATHYAGRVTQDAGRVDTFKYEVRYLGQDRLIFFMDISGQIQTFFMVLSLSCAIACICWMLVLAFVFLLSGRVVRPILAGMEKQKQFITNAGHELKTPLSIIQSNNDAATLLYGENKYSKNIRLQSQRLNGLMNDLLTLARLDEGAPLPRESVSLGPLIQGVLPAYEASFAQKGICLFVSLGEGVTVQAHADTLSRMFSLLLDNAVRYTPQGGTARLTVHRMGEHAEVLAENTCDAPQEKDPERLFERFYRGDSARTQGEGATAGYGIGLSAARAMAEAFGATLRAAYTEEGMIRFTVRFP